MAKECNNKKNRDNKITPYTLPRDETSSFVPYCTYEQHPGIIDQAAYKKCRRQGCFHLYRFRPEGA